MAQGESLVAEHGLEEADLLTGVKAVAIVTRNRAAHDGACGVKEVNLVHQHDLGNLRERVDVVAYLGLALKKVGDRLGTRDVVLFERVDKGLRTVIVVVDDDAHAVYEQLGGLVSLVPVRILHDEVEQQK